MCIPASNHNPNFGSRGISRNSNIIELFPSKTTDVGELICKRHELLEYCERQITACEKAISSHNPEKADELFAKISEAKKEIAEIGEAFERIAKGSRLKPDSYQPASL